MEKRDWDFITYLITPVCVLIISYLGLKMDIENLYDEVFIELLTDIILSITLVVYYFVLGITSLIVYKKKNSSLQAYITVFTLESLLLIGVYMIGIPIEIKSDIIEAYPSQIFSLAVVFILWAVIIISVVIIIAYLFSNLDPIIKPLEKKLEQTDVWNKKHENRIIQLLILILQAILVVFLNLICYILKILNFPIKMISEELISN